MNSQNKLIQAGFWIRLLATWIDCILIYIALTLFFYLLVYTTPSLYFPFNFTFFVTGLSYSAIFIAIKGQTPGKYLMGITVYQNDTGKLPVYKALLRESVLKIISGVFLFLGFFWIGFTKKKKGWHDYMIKSAVLKNKTILKTGWFWKMAAIASFLFFSLSYIWGLLNPFLEARKMDINLSEIRLPFMDRDPSAVTDISAIKDTSLISWISKNAQSAETYAIQAASAHQVTLFGEMHENADNLNFFNQIIPKLYHQSGIRVIAMEVIPDVMNKKADELVNAKIYDSSLALEIARSQSWKMWGMKEYWDVLKTVWKLNRSLPQGAEKMRVIGLDADWEMPNLSLLGNSQDSKGKTGFWEKFRIFSTIGDLSKFYYRDQLMARNVEKEIINKHQKAVVWIGINHTYINFTPTRQKNNKPIVTSPRFAFLLSQKYKNTFFQIELHQKFIFSDSDTLCQHSMAYFMDSVMKKNGNKPVGFTIANSPFENLRDHGLSIFARNPSLRYGDLAQGFIFLTPFEINNECTWQPGYITNEMFMKYKPMYDLAFGKNPKLKFKNADELNRLLESYLGKKNF